MKHYNNLPQDELIYTSTDNKLFSNKGIGFTENNTSIDFFIAAEQFIVSIINN